MPEVVSIINALQLATPHPQARAAVLADIGANVGVFSFAAAVPGYDVYAFGPCRATCRRCTRRCAGTPPFAAASLCAPCQWRPLYSTYLERYKGCGALVPTVCVKSMFLEVLCFRT